MTTNLVVPVVDGNVDAALRKLKKLSVTTGLFREMKVRSFYTKPGERRRLKSLKARRAQRKAARRRADWDRGEDLRGR